MKAPEDRGGHGAREARQRAEALRHAEAGGLVKALEHLHQRHRAGDAWVLLEALAFCEYPVNLRLGRDPRGPLPADDMIPIPRWALDALYALGKSSLERAPARGQRTELTRLEGLAANLARFLVVEGLRRKGSKIPAVFEEASEQLGQVPGSSDRSVKESYYLVAKEGFAAYCRKLPPRTIAELAVRLYGPEAGPFLESVWPSTESANQRE